jgi:hypothetical protein
MFLIDTKASLWNILFSFLSLIKAVSVYRTANGSLLVSQKSKPEVYLYESVTQNKVCRIILGSDGMGCAAG